MKILVTGGPVHAKLDAVKFVTNRFKGGLMAKLTDELRNQDCDVTYLCSKDARRVWQDGDWSPADDPKAGPGLVKVVFHDGFHDYRAKVMEMAPDFDAVVLGAAVANLIPVGYWKTEMKDMDSKEWIDTVAQVRKGECPDAYVAMPLEGKFPSHDYKPGDRFYMDWQIAPRIIDEVKARMKPGAHLFGFKLLSGVPHEELVTAAYDILLESRATTVFANDATNLGLCYGVGKDRSSREVLREWLAEEIVKMVNDEYYRTEARPGTVDHTYWLKLKDLAKQYELNFPESQNGMVFGTIAANLGSSGFVTTGRGKRELDEIAFVERVDHENRIVYARGGKKATLNAPLIDRVFKTVPQARYVVHYHEPMDGLPTLPWAPPGTVRDSIRDVDGSFNIDSHGAFLVFDDNRKGKRMIVRGEFV